MNNENQKQQAVLTMNGITRHFEQGGQRLDVLRGVDLSIERGEIVALLGPSGCGKTTLLQIAGLLENPDDGQIAINGKSVAETSDNYRTELRRTQIGFVYQFHHLLSDFTALENLLLPQYVAGVNKKEAKAHAEKLLESVGLTDRMHHYPSQLSGGEQQRVAIARGLVNRPSLLLADEPTGNLDPETSEFVFKTLVQTIRSLRIGALVVTHNHELAHKMDRVLSLDKGKVVSS